MTETLSPTELASYQHEMIDFIIDKPKCALWVGMGLGKTVATLTAVQHLFEQIEIRRVLVIAPLRVAKSTWPDEIANWTHTNDLTYSIVCGSAAQRSEALRKNVQLYFINRENVVWLIEELKGQWPFDMIVIDEASSFRSHSSKRFKALKKVAHLANRVVELTGTPAPKDLLAIWSQIFLLDQGDRLGRTITAYRNRWFAPDYMGYNWELRPGAQEEIEERISDIVLVLDEKDHVYWKEPEHYAYDIDLPPEAWAQYRELEKEFILRLENAEEIEAVNAAVLSGKLRQYANGALYTDDKGRFTVVHESKIQGLRYIAALHPDEPILVGYNFKSDKDRILRQSNQAELLTTDPEVIRRWNEGKIQMLLAHPASAGHGLNLQRGGRVIVWFGDTWDLELYLQFNARLARRGQKKDVIIYHLCIKNTVDEVIMKTLENRERSQKALLNALKTSIINDNQEFKKVS